MFDFYTHSDISFDGCAATRELTACGIMREILGCVRFCAEKACIS